MRSKILNRVRTVSLGLFAAGAALLSSASCDRMIYDYEGDCTVNYLLKFRYDLNLKWADAFANEVKSVRLYVFDESGTLVREIDDRGDRLADPDYAVNLEVPAGKYHLLAWCGIDNEGAPAQFTVPAATVGSTRAEALTCRIDRGADATSSGRLEFMFHGELDVDLPEDEDGGDYVYTMPLTKDTNHIRVILQHLSGEDVDFNQFSFKIEDANGYYASDNRLLPDDAITYLPFSTSSGVAGIIRDDGTGTRAEIRAKTAVADFSVGRMMANRARDMRLTITNAEGEDIARIPVIDYALLAKDYYELAYNRTMRDQEFLDREDEYVMTFFLDENMKWYAAEIYILSWRIVLHGYDVNSVRSGSPGRNEDEMTRS